MKGLGIGRHCPLFEGAAAGSIFCMEKCGYRVFDEEMIRKTPQPRLEDASLKIYCNYEGEFRIVPERHTRKGWICVQSRENPLYKADFDVKEPESSIMVSSFDPEKCTSEGAKAFERDVLAWWKLLETAMKKLWT